jgi:colanic acid biosynthesis glycosyl transferase WcaI
MRGRTFAAEFRMKILLLNQAFHPDVVATGQYLSELALELVKRGHAVTVVTGRQAYHNRQITFAPRENWAGVEIHRIYSTGYSRKTKWRRAADFASFMLSCCSRLAMLPRHDAVVALTTPPLISFLGAWRARLWRSRFFYWVMDLNPDEAIATGWLQRESAPARVLEKMSRFGLQQADAIVALDRFMRDQMVAKGISSEKIAVIPPWSHDDVVCFDALGRKKFRKAHGLDGKFVVMYSGNHSPVHPLDTLLRAAEKLRTNPDIVFCFVGGGGEFERVQQWATNGNGNALCLPYQPLDQLAASLSAADLHIVVMGDSVVGLVHPCKIYNIMAVGAPLLYIGPQPSHVTEILHRLGRGHPWAACPHGDGQQASDQIQRLMNRAGNGSRRVPVEVAADFSKRALLPRMIAELERLERCARSGRFEQ